MQPTASSAPPARRSTGTAPAEWQRSQTTRAPAARARSVSPGDVGDLAAAVVDVRVHDQRGAVERRGDIVDEPQLDAALRGQAFEHVAVGREAAALDDQRPGAEVERRARRACRG